MSRKRKKRTAAVAPTTAWGLEATRPDVGGLLSWPTLDSRRELTPWDQQTLYKSARALYYNCGRIRKAVEMIVNLQGWAMPQPCTPDEDWNRTARAHFLRCVMNPFFFDTSGALNFVTAQLWLEQNRCIDGDALCVMGRYGDRATFSFYKAPQISEDGYGHGLNTGVAVNAAGRPVSYRLYDYAADTSRDIPAGACWLYRHNPEPSYPRGVTDLVAAIVNARDLAEIAGYLKASLKLTAAIGLVETKKEGDKHPGVRGQVFPTAPVSMGEGAMTVARMVGATTITSLAPGRDVKVVNDNRPGPNSKAFMDFLIADLAHSVGLDPTVLYDSTQLGSAGTRFDLAKLARWTQKRLQWRTPGLTRIWRHVIACEIAAGRLAPPKSGHFDEVFWVPCRDMTIDVGRIAAATINLVREGLMSPAAFTLATEGRLPEDVDREKARRLANQRALEVEFGLPAGSLHQSALGATDSAPNPDNTTTE
ncbi:MAG: phage portal protein [Akkermansia sp.]|nr:phage portal protein [Akkermansia sp.]